MPRWLTIKPRILPVDARKREGVFRAVTVEIGVVDTHSPLAGFLGYKNRIGEPNRVFTFTDESDS
jgi:hypothetical protein